MASTVDLDAGAERGERCEDQVMAVPPEQHKASAARLELLRVRLQEIQPPTGEEQHQRGDRRDDQLARNTDLVRAARIAVVLASTLSPSTMIVNSPYRSAM